MTNTAHLGLPLIAASQSQKHVTHNQAVVILDAIVQLSVKDSTHGSPPAAIEGDRYKVASGASGTWSAWDLNIALYTNGAWQKLVPQKGWACYDEATGDLTVWNGTTWINLFDGSNLQNVALLGIGTTADASNPFSAKLNSALWTAKTAAEGGTGDLRYKLNKESAAKTLSLLMQTNYSGRAEIGLTGDDRLHMKVSSDGSTWKEAVVVDQNTGNVGIGTANPTQRLEVNGGNIRLSNSDFVAGSAGTFLDASLGVSSGTTYGRIQVFTSGGLAIGDLVLNLYGNVGVGTTTPTCKLDVAGPARVAQYAKSTLPSAATCGAGAMVYVTDEIGGAVIAFSDGTNWRRVTDRAVVT